MSDEAFDDEIARVLAVLREEYRAVLPEKLDALRQAVAHLRALEADGPSRDDAWSRTRRMAHALRGTAGSYGFHEIGEAAGAIEDALTREALAAVDEAAWASVDEALGRLMLR